MPMLREQILAETTMRELLEQYELPQPDRVEYGHACIRLFFFDTKTVVVVDFDQAPEHSPNSLAESGDREEQAP
jgi:hypothetical protein